MKFIMKKPCLIVLILYSQCHLTLGPSWNRLHDVQWFQELARLYTITAKIEG